MLRTLQGRDFTAYIHGTIELSLGECSGSVMVASCGSALILKGGHIVECPGDGPGDAPIVIRDKQGRVL